MSVGPSRHYLAKFNSLVLPGYVQKEALATNALTVTHAAPYADGAPMEYIGRANKTLQLTLRVWEQDYATCKRETQRAATILRSKKYDFAPLYVQYPDRYYTAKTTSVKIDKAVPSSVRILDYEAVFECKPWLAGVATQTLTGTGIITTDQVSRSIEDGGWTPATITVTGTDVTVSGYTDTEFTGYFSAPGAVTGLVVDSEAVTATAGGINQNSAIPTVDYRVYVAPGKTSFAITGALTCSITYQNRWYL